MPTPRRRSSRLRGSSATPGKSASYQNNNRLASLAEHDESPTTQSNAVLSSPSAPRTPATAARIKPSLEDMHPSKAQQSTAKQPDSDLQLGFRYIDGGDGQASGINQQTPSKTPVNSAFNFRFARPAPELGPEAQRMMDGLREEALRIKAKLAAEREEENRNNGELNNGVGGRKIAQPKGKVGRFSDIHMAEFKKMDSIAGHPSAFRAQTGRSTPVKMGLKRTQSHAKLDEREDIKEDFKDFKALPASARSTGNERLENDAPAKRARKNIADDTSTARPVSQDGNPSTPRSQPNVFASLTTPTQSSLARAATSKAPVTQIPTLSRSPSKPSLLRTPSRPNLLSTPRGLQKSATTNNINFPRSESKLFERSPGKIEHLKSILRHPVASAKKPSAIPSAIPTSARSPTRPDLDKALPSIPTTPGGLSRSKSVKHVNFTPETTGRNAATLLNSPSPIKSGIPRSTSKINFQLKSITSNQPIRAESKAGEVQYPSIPSQSLIDEKPKFVVEYPSLTGVRPLPLPPTRAIAKIQPQPSVPGNFTFRSDHTINFGNYPAGFGSSPGQSSVRQVRQSVFPSMPGSFPEGNKENKAPLPAIPHGMSNKKRRHIDSDEEREDEEDRSPKKRKTAANLASDTPSSKPGIPMSNTSSRNPTPAKKKGLSLSRLNMLSRPKVRK